VLFFEEKMAGRSKNVKRVTRSDDVRSKYVSIIIPVYNEEENIPLLHERIQQVMEKQQNSYEVIYVDDGSKDATFVQLKRLVLLDEHVQVVHLRRNFGQTAAIAAGVANSSGEILIFMDGDLQNDPIDIPRLLAKLDEGYDVVSGWRKNRQDARLSRKLPSMLANKLISRVTGVHLHDYGCTLKAYRYEVFKHIRLYGEMHRFIPAYVELAGASIAEIEVNHHARRFGKSKYGISRTGRVLLDLITLKFLGSFGTKPLYAFGMLGLLSLLLSVAMPGYVLSRRICHPSVRLQRSPWLPISLLFLVFGFLSIMMGLLAELLTRTYHESQDKPTYVVKHILPQPKMESIEEAIMPKLEVLSERRHTSSSVQIHP
jgi:glycosyltransferase involved in cell wall biosynthesis